MKVYLRTEWTCDVCGTKEIIEGDYFPDEWVHDIETNKHYCFICSSPPPLGVSVKDGVGTEDKFGG